MQRDVILKNFEDKSIEEFIVPKDVTVLDRACFEGCTKLRKVILNEGLKSIGAEAFADTCITELVIPQTVTHIEYRALACDTLVKVEFAEGTKEVVKDICAECTKLEEVVIPPSVEVIQAYAFYNCYHLTSVKIPEGVTEIGRNAFYGCFKLNEVKLPSTLKKIGRCAFQNTGIEEIVFPKDLEIIGGSAFESCRLREVVIPSGIKQMGLAFNNNEYLKSFRFSEDAPLNIITAPLWFEGCPNLQESVLPKDLKDNFLKERLVV